ncbi:hypothetical protein BTO06_16425 [Tenacibaculum sp. SZ-18]|nr:hypothetical protein BTO06_16425 [Tenacibaculum sp. SZ-18]
MDKVSQGYFFSVIKMYLHALVAFLIGAVVYYDLSVKKNKLFFNRNFTEYLFFKYKSSSSLKLEIIAPIMVFSIIGMYFLLYGNGILIIDYYINEVSRGLKIAIELLSFIALIILGLLNEKHPPEIEAEISNENLLLFKIHSIVNFKALIKRNFFKKDLTDAMANTYIKLIQ